ncbi:PQQ-dependent sugar dehydrogenase [Bacillus sp. FJAT-27245]|uniref:PQQ-dependent sugar dehydrogenase n=1 Tax=Bacillus sp. FJAT-27245 TaxID=1684144 RepID=UPI0006A7AD52|nr:PQQ-dependent sugar dehydrogenase [Bacillus sp. FJAT-27245]
MPNVKVRLQPIVRNINLPTVVKTAFLPGDQVERVFIATQVGEIFYIGDGGLRTFLDIRSRIIKLGHAGGGYDERGLLGLAFHPQFTTNGHFYLHYSVAGTQGPGALTEEFHPDPCDPRTLNLRWTNRETRYDHIDTVEEWILPSNGLPQKRRTLLNIRRPFFNHNGVNSLNFSPETGKLVLTTGDGGAGYDPFNLAQDDMEIAGKIIEIDISKNKFINNPPVATRFNELPRPIQETLTVIAKGVRNIPGISYQRIQQQLIKHVGIVGQDFAESIFSFIQYQPIPVTRLVEAAQMNAQLDQTGLINFGWRGWEGAFPTPVIRSCPGNPTTSAHSFAFYSDAVAASTKRLPSLTTYFHKDSRPGKFGGTALTGVQAYMGTAIPALTGSVVFTDLARKETSPAKGVLAYTTPRTDGHPNDYSIIETDQPSSAYYVNLGTNMNQTRLYLGAYGSMRVTDLNQGTVFEILP